MSERQGSDSKVQKHWFSVGMAVHYDPRIPGDEDKARKIAYEIEAYAKKKGKRVGDFSSDQEMAWEDEE